MRECLFGNLKVKGDLYRVAFLILHGKHMG